MMGGNTELSQRSVLGKAWRKRRYKAAFIAKLSECEVEAAETQIWIEFAVKCNYLSREEGKRLYLNYNSIIGKLVAMINNPNNWTLQITPKSPSLPVSQSPSLPVSTLTDRVFFP
jgi:23S rRNA-intervening sequence protein